MKKSWGTSGGQLSTCLLGLICLAGAVRADDIRKITLVSNDIAYSPATQQIYASVPSSVAKTGNSITSVDPYAGTVGSSVFVGSEPSQLAVSDDGQFVYVALNGQSSIGRFDTATGKEGLKFSIDSPFQAEDLKVLPGEPHSLAVVREDPRFSPHFAGTYIYDDGVARANHTDGLDSIAFSASASRMYGYENSITSFDFDRINVDDTGFTTGTQNGNLIGGFGLTIKFDSGLLFVSNGQEIDPEAQTTLGSFSGVGSGPFVPDVKNGLVFFLTGSGSTLTLKAFDINTFLQVGFLDIPGVSGSPSSLIRWGANGLAFRTSGGQMFLIRTDMLPGPQWRAVAEAVDSNNHTRVLWNKSDGTMSLWDMDSGGNLRFQNYGPYPGWSAQALAVGADNTVHILWANTAGALSLWTIDSVGRITHAEYGPYAGWNAKSLSVSPDGIVHVLWNFASNGQISLWSVSPDNTFTYINYGPFAGWNAQFLTSGTDNHTHVLWNHVTDNQVSLWDMNSAGAYSHAEYGPFPGWTASALAVGPDNHLHVLWNSSNGAQSLWDMNPTGAVAHVEYGPYSDWAGTSIAVGPDNDVHILWDKLDGTVSLWDIGSSGSVSFRNYGPF